MNKKIVKYSVLSIILLLVLVSPLGCEISITFDSKPNTLETDTTNK